MKPIHAGFVAAIRERLKARKVSARAAASNAGLPERSVQGVLEGHVPSIDRAAEICRALDLEFYLGPVRSRVQGRAELPAAAGPKTARGGPGLGDVEKHLQGLISAVIAAGGNPFPPDLRDETLTGLVATHDAPPGARPVDVVEFAAAAGGGVEVDGERVRGLAWFARSWLDRLNLDARRCAIIRVRGGIDGADVARRVLDFVRPEPAGAEGAPDLRRADGRRVDREACSEARRRVGARERQPRG